MADSNNTRIASAIPQHTRRALCAGLTLAPVAGLPAVAGAVSAAPMSDALAQAIERHRVAHAAIESHTGPEDIPLHIMDVEGDALAALVETPCANDAELLQKMRYLVAYERYNKRWRPFSIREDEAIAAALDEHFQTQPSFEFPKQEALS